MTNGAMYPLTGLSSLTRGNRDHQGEAALHDGPIPAHAGQPMHKRRSCSIPWAYPRSRGATDLRIELADGTVGLSPLTRGNQILDDRALLIVGPIPAHAGQPA